MVRSSVLSEDQRHAVMALFDAGYGRKAAATRLGVGVDAVRKVHDRWRLRGAGALVAKSTKRVFSFELKLGIVERFLGGEPKMALAEEFDLSAPDLISAWVRIYRAEGEDGLRPKPNGRPKRDPDAPHRELSELELLRRENERLRAEVAYLGKLRALTSHERR
jgi:transposase-like protein